jgi:hypothetical protein
MNDRRSNRQMVLAALLMLMAGARAEAAPPPATGSPKSAACASALDTLRAQEDRVIAAARERIDAARQRMLQARRVAALACLGEAGEEALPPSSRIESPLAPVPRNTPAERPPQPVAPTAVAAPRVPRTLGACDANGCWTSDGVRLQRVGPQLLGPGGFCSTAGTAVQCP